MSEKYKNIGDPIDRLSEECSEVIIECAKIIKTCQKINRFGWKSYHPEDPEKIINVAKLQLEMDDVNESFERLKKETNNFTLIMGDIIYG